VAYDVEDFQVMGGPSWASSDGYDVNAKAGGNATFAQMRPILQSLLADRFQLTLRRETKDLPVYELTVAKGGIKIAAVKEGKCVTFDPNHPPPLPAWQRRPPPLNICEGVRHSLDVGPERTETIEASGISMPRLTEVLSDDLGRIVFDKTGFREKFDVRLEFSPDEAEKMRSHEISAPPADQGGPSIFTALQEQLGLRLMPAKGPLEVLVIDHVERQSEN